MELVGLVKDHLSLFQQNFPFARYDFGCAAVNIDEFPEIMRFARSDKVLRVFKVVNGVEIPHRKTGISADWLRIAYFDYSRERGICLL